MNTAQKVLGNTAIQAVGRLTTAAVSIIVLKLISTYLGKSGYGAYTTVYEFLAFFAIIADFGIFQIAVKEMSAHPDRRREIFGNVLLAHPHRGLYLPVRLRLQVVGEGVRRLDQEYVLKNSFGFGGCNSCIIFRRTA